MGWWCEIIDIVKENDLAVCIILEVLLIYLGVKVLAVYCFLYFFWKYGFKFLVCMYS